MRNSDQFFHGTTYNIKDGVVRPAWQTKHGDVSEYSFGDPGDLSEGDHAFAIRNDEAYAWHAANTFHGSGGRGRVYEVEPAKDMVPGPWNKEHPDFAYHSELDPDDPDYEDNAKEHSQDEWASPTGYKVKQRIDTMPGRQGTIPLNWNQFRDLDTWIDRRRPSLNHPSDAQISRSMNGPPEEPDPGPSTHQRLVAENLSHARDAGRGTLPIAPNHPTLF